MWGEDSTLRALPEGLARELQDRLRASTRRDSRWRLRGQQAAQVKEDTQARSCLGEKGNRRRWWLGTRRARNVCSGRLEPAGIDNSGGTRLANTCDWERC